MNRTHSWPPPGRRLAFLSWLALASVLGADAASQCERVEDLKILATGPAAGDIYAAALEVDGNVAVIANEWDDDNGTDSGSVFAYRRVAGQWVEEQKLKPADGATGDNFGRSVDLHDDVIVVGAHWDDDNGRDSGSVYVFRHDGSSWQQEQKLKPANGRRGDRFGISVSVEDDVLVVGSWRDDTPKGTDSGSAFVFRFDGSTWVEEVRLTASDGAAGDFFGRFVDLEGDVIVVGAFGDDDRGTDAGAAYVFRHDGTRWVEEQKLTASDGAPLDNFGWEGALSGPWIVIGSFFDDTPAGTDAGSAHAYEHDGTTWIERQKLESSGANGTGAFGGSVSLDGDRLLIGAYLEDRAGTDSGATYYFQYDGSRWQEEQVLSASDLAPGDWNGFWVSVSGTTAFSGSWRNDDAGPDTGAAYVYELTDLLLTANQSSYQPGDTLTLTTCGGLAGGGNLLAVVDVNGTGTFFKVSLGIFDGSGHHRFTAPVPPGLAGFTVQFLALGFDGPGDLDRSNPVTITFL